MMQSGIYVGLSVQMALRQRMETLANNVANMNTPGFRAEAVKFESILLKAGSEQIAFGSKGDPYFSTAAGSTVKTGNPLDVAVSGAGWMAVQAPDGRIYTRDGRMVMAANGTLTTINGLPVLDAGGSPIQLDPNAPQPVISRDGMLTQAGNQVGAIGLFAMDPEATLTRAAGSGVQADRPPTPITDFVRSGLAQGFVEGANVNPVQEMSKLIAVQRLFEAVSASLESTDSTMIEAIRTLGS